MHRATFRIICTKLAFYNRASSTTRTNSAASWNGGMAHIRARELRDHGGDEDVKMNLIQLLRHNQAP